MSISKYMQESMARASWIRRMFEEGAELKKIHGPENVYDFSLGNPDVEPPEAFFQRLEQCIKTKGTTLHGYMPNTGFPDVRRSVAKYISKEQDVPVTEAELIMTCGAAGALNVILKAILDPGDEVITPAPFFAEYGFYAANHGGVLKTVATREDFSLDLAAMEAAITPRTKAVLINSPNNPTGRVYDEASLHALGELLSAKGKELNRTIYLLSDEPYRKIVYDGKAVPSIFSVYQESIVATSFSKDLSIPGERIGWLAVHPHAAFKKDLLNAMAMANRILGFVNAPALMQRVVEAILGEHVDPGKYKKRRDILCKGLAGAGYDFILPDGAFYLFPKAPGGDDVAFCRALVKERILAVPGTGFGGPGYFRIAYCTDAAVIERALPGFAKVIREFA